MAERTLWDNYFRVHTIQLNGAELPLRQILNFIGSTGQVDDNETEGRTDITLGGGGGGANTIHNGVGIPSNALGADGDFYVRTSNWTIFGPKTSGVWGTATSLVGAMGPTGASGTNGNTVRSGTGVPSSGLGANGDYYIDTSNHDIYGPKTSGAWGSPTSLVGPTGATGPAGPMPNVTGTGFPTVTGGIWDNAATPNVRYVGGKFQTDANLQWKAGANLGDLAWSPSAARTLTLPDATDTLVGRSTTDTLASKTIVLANNTVTDTSAVSGDIQVHNGTRFARQAKGSNNTYWGVNGSGVVGYYAITGAQVVAPGSSGMLLYNSSNQIAAVSNWTHASNGLLTDANGYISFQSAASTGLVRIKHGVLNRVLVTEDGAGGNRTLLRVDTSVAEVELGHLAYYTIIESNELRLRVAGSNALVATTAAVQCAKPRHGLSTPYASEGLASISVSANYTLVASEYSRALLYCTVTGHGYVYTLPAPANNDAAYAKDIYVHNTDSSVVFTTGSGATVTVTGAANEKGARLWFTAAGVFRVTQVNS